MRLSRLRSGERLALVGGVALAVTLCLDWWFLSTPDARVGAHESGLRSLGWVAELLVIAAALCALAFASFTVTHRAPAIPVILSVFTVVLGFVATVAIVLRLIFQPTLGVEATAGDVEVELPAWLGLFSAMAITVGGWIAVLDERTDAPDSVEQTEEVLRVRGAPRPAPPASS